MGRKKKKSKRIPTPVTKKTCLLKDSITVIANLEDGVRRNFRLSFDYYKHKLCEIENLDATTARKCLKHLKKIGTCNFNNLKESNLNPTPAKSYGDYQKIFNGLPEDADVYKIDFGSSSRLFYFVVENLFHIVLIKHKHFEDRKSRR